MSGDTRRSEAGVCHAPPLGLAVPEALTPPSPGGERYLLYTRHTRIDLFKGVFAGMVRHLVEKRIRSEAPAALDGMRRRLESGEPPAPTPPPR